MLTKLAAVNTMLAGIGEAPVTSLTAPSDDVATAVACLDWVLDDILTTGWSDNTDDNVTMIPDVNGNILVPTGALSIDTIGTSKTVDVTIRVDAADNLRKLWNRTDRTFVFTRPLVVRQVVLRAFEELVRPLARYITARAAVRFQKQQLASSTVDKLLMRDEAEAKAALDDYEAEQDDANVLTDSPHCAWITYRNNPFYGR